MSVDAKNGSERVSGNTICSTSAHASSLIEARLRYAAYITRQCEWCWRQVAEQSRWSETEALICATLIRRRLVRRSKRRLCSNEALFLAAPCQIRCTGSQGDHRGRLSRTPLHFGARHSPRSQVAPYGLREIVPSQPLQHTLDVDGLVR